MKSGSGLPADARDRIGIGESFTTPTYLAPEKEPPALLGHNKGNWVGHSRCAPSHSAQSFASTSDGRRSTSDGTKSDSFHLRSKAPDGCLRQQIQRRAACPSRHATTGRDRASIPLHNLKLEVFRRGFVNSNDLAQTSGLLAGL